MFIAEYLIKKRQGFSAASVYFRRDIQFHIKSSPVTIMYGDMISSLIMILWHSVRQDIASYIVSKHNKVKSITISKALSTFNMVPCLFHLSRFLMYHTKLANSFVFH